MGETNDGHAGQGAAAPADADPDSPARSFFSRIFGRDTSDEAEPGQASSTAVVGGRVVMANLRRLRHLRVDDVSVPRADIVAVPDDATLEAVVAVFKQSALSRLPVYSESLDQPIGLVHFKDVALRYGFGDPSASFDLRGAIRPVLYAPPSMPIWALLQKMQTTRTHMALVIDEYGGVDGLVTLENVLEEIVGNIPDEHDEDESQFAQEEAPGVFLTRARLDLEAFEAMAGVRLAPPELAEEVDTIGGLAIRLAGRVPARGELVAHPEGHELEVVDADARRINRLRVRLATGERSASAEAAE